MYIKLMSCKTPMKSIACSRQHADAAGKEVFLFLNKIVKSEQTNFQKSDLSLKLIPENLLF